MEVPDWVKVEVSRNEKPLGTITFWDGELDLVDIHPAPERESLRRVFAENRENPRTYAASGRGGELTPRKYDPKTVAWFNDVLSHVLVPDGYRYVELGSGTRPPRDTP